MNKVIITMVSIIVVIGATLTAIAIFSPNRGEEAKGNEQTTVEETKVAEEILDECTDEYEIANNASMLETNANQEKTSPNCAIITKTYYEKCGHETSEYANLPSDLVNLSETEIKEKYPDYDVESFSSNEVVLYQNKGEECGEHYMVKDKEGSVVVYRILEDGSQTEYETTGITTEYLPETDKINIQNGIQVNGKKDLNQLIEDFE